jgi:hypothetical protein
MYAGWLLVIGIFMVLLALVGPWALVFLMILCCVINRNE